MVVSWIPLPLNIPILNSANSMAFVEEAKHDLDFVPDLLFWVIQEKVQASTTRLLPFTANHLYLAKAKQRRIFFDSILQPPFVQAQGLQSGRSRLFQFQRT